MTFSKKLAIVIPYYRLDYFDECLESLVAQTNNNFNVYIGNDASPQNPDILIDSYREKLNITYRRFEKNLGSFFLTHHWERCIKMSNEEEWIMILGDDDLLDESIVENFYSNYDSFNGKSNVVRYASQVIGAEGTVKSSVYKHPKWETAPDSFFRWINGNTRSSLSEHVFTKKSYLYFGFKDYPIGWHSDDIAWLDFPVQKSIYSINSSTVFIRHSGLNLTTATDNLDIKEEASLRFQNDLIFEKLILFSRFQKRKLLLNFEIFKKSKDIMSMKDWNILFIFYFKYSSLLQILKLVRRFFIYQFKKVNN